MSVSTHTKNKSLFLQLLQAARGKQQQYQSLHHAVGKDARQNHKYLQMIEKATTESTAAVTRKKLINELPCFPLYPEHIRTISPPLPLHEQSSSTKNANGSQSNNEQQAQVSPSPQEFHQHLCKSIQSAKKRVKLATLYIGAGNGCMSMSSSKSVIESKQNPVSYQHEDDEHSASSSSSSYVNTSPREVQLLQHLRQLSIENDDGNNDVEIKIVMDASRALRPIRVVQPSEEVPIKNRNKSTTTKSTNNNVMTSSAREVFYSLFPEGKKRKRNQYENAEKGVSLFNFHSGFTASLPSPLNEIMGVFHLKVYIIDDELILSGANLSEEYFTDRLDRYMSFVGGANGLVDFYSDLIDILYDHSTEYEPSATSKSSKSDATTVTSTPGNIGMNEESLIKALNELFDGSKNSLSISEQQLLLKQQEYKEENHKKTFAFAIPTFQMSKDFVKRNSNIISFPQDVDVIGDMLCTTWNCSPHSCVYVSSAYLNPTPFFMSAIEKFGSSSTKDGGASFLLSASPTSHGFKPKKKNDAVNGNGKGWIPSVFLNLAEEIHSKIKHNGGKILLYHREGYTFHAKGIWVTSGLSSSIKNTQSSLGVDKDKSLEEGRIVNPESDLIASVIGSSNFGSRSEMLDWESNCLLVMNPSVCDKKANDAKAAIAGDWNNMLKHCIELGSREDLKSTSDMSMNGMLSKVAIQIARKFF